MKSIIPLSAITVLAALALAGCDQNSPTKSTETPATNASMSHESGMMNQDDGMMNGTTNMMPTTNLPNMTMSGTTNMPVMNTNMPASTNQ